MASPSSQLSTAEMQFISAAVPNIASGTYDISAFQFVQLPNDPQVFTASQRIVVNGPRYSLPVGTVASVFPPAGQAGDYGTVLPHIVLNSQTLPWQRNGKSTSTTPSPWLALLTVSATDFIAGTVSSPALGTVNDLLSTNDSTFVSYSWVNNLAAGESSNDPITYVDLQLTQNTVGGTTTVVLPALLPGLDDLPFLAHVRQMSDEVVETFPFYTVEQVPRATYSVVISNRLPPVSGDSEAITCLLVSVEDLDQIIATANAASNLPTLLRLVVLASWSFTNDGDAADFAALMQGVNVNPTTLQVPIEGNDTQNAQAAAFVTDALEMGYTALAHVTRQGAQTVSWYRGPLLPYGNPTDLNGPPPYPDSALRYEPDTGMFDVSLSAAWQLGQLMALADRSFAAGLFRFKTDLQRSRLATGARPEIFGPGPARDAVAEALVPALSAFVKGTAR